MRTSPRRRWHELASDAHQMFIAHPTSLVRLKLDRPTIKGMEAFMLGNTVRAQCIYYLNIYVHRHLRRYMEMKEQMLLCKYLHQVARYRIVT